MVAITSHTAGSGTQAALSRIYLVLFPAPVILFTGALLTDIAYAATAYLMWLHFSEWLIAAGFALGALAALVLVSEFIANAALRRTGRGVAHLLMFLGALAVELVNSFVHAIDGWTAVVPGGLVLSLIGAALALGATATLFRGDARRMRAVHAGDRP